MTTPKVRKIAAFLFVLGVLLTACSSPAGKGGSSSGTLVRTEKGQYTNITVSELQTMLKTKDFRLINVHVPYAGHIDQTDAFIPYDKIAQNLDQLPENRNAKIVLYCRGGSMSAAAARTLADLGYNNVSQLVGGFSDWKAAGLPLETQQP